MGAVAVYTTSRWVCAVHSCSTRASHRRHHHACTPTTRPISCCQTGSQEPPLQHGQAPFNMSSSSPSPIAASPLPSSSSCLIVARDVQAGEIIKHHGTIMVKGNVNSGAVILASGDIVVLGELEGEAHAGRHGDVHAVIFSWHLKSNTLSIAGCEAEGSPCSGGHICKVAYLSSGRVSIEDAGSQGFKFPPSTSGCEYASTRTTLNSGAKPWFGIDVMSMRKPSKVAAFTGAYIFIIGLALLLFPEPLFGLFFNLKSSVKEWIRVGAVLAVVFGVYYLGTAWGDAKGCNGADSFYISTIVGRMVMLSCY